IKALEDPDDYVRCRAADALGKIGSERAIDALIKALEDPDDYVRSSAAYALRKIGSERAIDALIKALKCPYDSVRYVSRKSGSERAIEALIKALENEAFVKRNTFYSAFAERNTFYSALQSLETVQKSCQYYRPPKLSSQSNTPTTFPTHFMYILHLSDLHFGTLDHATLWSNQLAEDLKNDIKLPHLDALILSGDIANYSTPEEYEAAKQFLDRLRQDFPLNPEQIIIVPGNHDLNWKISEEKAYTPIRRRQYQGKIDENLIIDKGEYIEVLNPEQYKRRFEHFSNFYQTLKGKPYPLDYDRQYTLDHFPNQNLLILGLNSAWQLDHHYTKRASINPNALSNALAEIRRHPDYPNCLKIAVWHHPIHSSSEDRITDSAFLQQLAVAGFRFFLHGHIHKAETSLYRYDVSQDGRNLTQICAGTFGASTKDLFPAYPWQYNLLKFEGNELKVYTRRREEENGAWQPDARWTKGAGKSADDYYTIDL
ncbi:MAG: HEAT repeat domain-containing protein, partial [Microcystaceae cyanobacterium]